MMVGWLSYTMVTVLDSVYKSQFLRIQYYADLQKIIKNVS